MSIRETVLHEDDEGKVSVVGNELIIEDKNHQDGDGDPVAIRFHSQNETIGKWSICAYRQGRYREIGLVMVKRDERGRNNPAHQDALEIRILTHIPGRESFEDADYKPMFSIRHDGIDLHGAMMPTAPKGFTSDDGRYLYNVQGDPTPEYPHGRIVQYDTRHPEFTSNPSAAAVAILKPEPL